MKRTVTVDTSKDFLSFAGIIRANVTQQDIFFTTSDETALSFSLFLFRLFTVRINVVTYDVHNHNILNSFIHSLSHWN